MIRIRPSLRMVGVASTLSVAVRAPAIGAPWLRTLPAFRSATIIETVRFEGAPGPA